jgi:hypothetical protein
MWTKKSKGNAKVYTHPGIDHAIVVNHNGISWNGNVFPTLDAAKAWATNYTEIVDSLVDVIRREEDLRVLEALKNCS